MGTLPHIAGLTNKNIFLVEFKEPYAERNLRDETTTNIRSIIFSTKGGYLAYRTDKRAEVVKCADWSVAAAIEGNIKDMLFSPLDNYFMVWEMFVMTKENPQPKPREEIGEYVCMEKMQLAFSLNPGYKLSPFHISSKSVQPFQREEGKPNVHVYNMAKGEIVASFSQKNQTGWEPKWSPDEKLFAVQAGNRVLIYEDGNFERFKQTINAENLKCFSIAPSTPAYYFSIFTLGKSGQPSVWRVLQYPNLQLEQALVSRTCFQADKAAFYWNRRGTNIFTLTQTDVDKTGGSYYGKQSLSYGDVKGNAGNMVFNKEGPVHAISWNPGNWNEWIAVYGHAPAKATLFNAKCDPLFEFGTGAWNTIYYPPDGTHVLLGGFGNIATGHIEVWDVRGYKRIGKCAAPDTTSLQWDPRGEAFLTATTYPRLTVGNGYKIWHYTGALMHKRACVEKEFLLALNWQPGAFPKSELSRVAPKGVGEAAAAPAAAYRPPGARNKPSTFTLHEHEQPHRPGEHATAAPSKQAIKQKEKREARKARKAEERVGGDAPAAPAAPAAPRPAFVSSGDPEKDKKIKNINKKLNDIEKLKQLRAAGKVLEINQKAKIEGEAALLKELEQLRL